MSSRDEAVNDASSLPNGGPISSSSSSSSEQELRDTYKLVLKFFRDNDGKTVHVPYAARLHLVALAQQVAHGPLDLDKVAPLGALDVIGKDRRHAWGCLGDMDKREAMEKFIEGVRAQMPHLNPFLEAHQKVKELKQKSSQPSTPDADDGGSAAAAAAAADESARLAQLERQRQEDQRRQIQDALNKQTFTQFRAYAEQQYPTSPDQQAVLIRQLQEQHYFQYMQQIYQQQMETHAKQTLASHGAAASGDLEEGLARMGLGSNVSKDHDSSASENSSGKDEKAGDERRRQRDHSGDEDDDEEDGVDDVAVPSMWTRKDIAEFKDAIRREGGGDGVIRVGHGETVTVRVPTHPGGSALFWEFATDSYDLAFGVFFEWQRDEGETEVSVHVSDSEDEDLDEDFPDENGDPESGGAASAALVEKGPPTSVVVPIYRRDCHQEVYAGSHQYPGDGVYLLKFDNTYSLWRSKTLYYRVCYTSSKE